MEWVLDQGWQPDTNENTVLINFDYMGGSKCFSYFTGNGKLHSALRRIIFIIPTLTHGIFAKFFLPMLLHVQISNTFDAWYYSGATVSEIIPICTGETPRHSVCDSSFCSRNEEWTGSGNWFHGKWSQCPLSWRDVYRYSITWSTVTPLNDFCGHCTGEGHFCPTANLCSCITGQLHCCRDWEKQWTCVTQ